MPRLLNRDHEPAVLTSWKEIASYLGKGVRTVQRWEAEFGLPVRRPGPNRHVVHASREELDNWLAHWSKRLESDEVDRKQLRVGVETSRELRKLQRQLVGELSNCLHALTGKCQQIASNFTSHDTPHPEGRRIARGRRK